MIFPHPFCHIFTIAEYNKDMSKKIRVGLLFGGKSGEHEVSLQSAKSIYDALDKEKYDIILIGIDKKGKWLLNKNEEFLLNSRDPQKIALNTENAIAVTPKMHDIPVLINSATGEEVKNIDVFFPIIHGTFGEDGSLQGLLELLDAPYVGAGVLGSAIGMDKDVMKRLLKQAHIKIAEFCTIKKNELDPIYLQEVAADLKYPLFIKPANLGSSVGVTKVHDKTELYDAAENAFQYDTKILMEEFIDGKEIECSVLGNNSPMASRVGEIIPQHEFYSYDAKYIDEKGAIIQIPAEIPQEIEEKIQEIAIKVFTTLDCSGMARVDFFVTDDAKIYVNEINTLPGFTKISMFPKLWEASGISYCRLLDKLISLAIERKEERRKLSYSVK
jgi:D-alanine-D-alanine ligase